MRMRIRKKTLVHLLTREITHANMFMKALDAMGRLDDPMLGNVPPDDTVRLVFNRSHGEDVREPWNADPPSSISLILPPQGGLPAAPINPDDERPAPAKAKAKIPRANDWSLRPARLVIPSTRTRLRRLDSKPVTIGHVVKGLTNWRRKSWVAEFCCG